MLVTRRWADRVFHVLAHVRASAGLAASVYDPVYVAFVARHAGPAGDRPLAEDAEVLGRALTTHEQLARAQLLAWLFVDEVRADACATRDLDQLRDDEVDHPELLPTLRALGAAAEVLRCAVHLERESHSRLPSVATDEVAVERAFRELVAIAPELATHAFALVPSLRLRGRVFDREIWTGAPGDERTDGPSIEHVAWQAAHEATVAEVAREASGAPLALGHEALEREALARLQQRAEHHGHAASHRRWRDHLAVGWR